LGYQSLFMAPCRNVHRLDKSWHGHCVPCPLRNMDLFIEVYKCVFNCFVHHFMANTCRKHAISFSYKYYCPSYSTFLLEWGLWKSISSKHY